MESKKLEALMMSVDLGSFTRAAEVLGYTQSGLTHMMNSLEKEIGVPLLERGRSGVRLTPEGERVAPAIRDFLDSASRLDAALTQAGDVRREAIRVGTYASMGVHWLPGIIRRFREECPEASVEMRVTNHIAEAYAALLQGKLDLIFASRQEPGDYQWISLWQDPMFAVLPRTPTGAASPWGISRAWTSLCPTRALIWTSCASSGPPGSSPTSSPRWWMTSPSSAWSAMAWASA